MAEQQELSMKERMESIRQPFIAAVKAYKEAGKVGDEAAKDKHLKEAAQLADDFTAFVNETGQYQAILVKVHSNLANIDKGAKPPKEATPKEEKKKAEPKAKKKAEPKAKTPSEEPKKAPQKEEKPKAAKTLPKTKEAVEKKMAALDVEDQDI